ncbi:MAG: 50S ribosomal protein L17 [Terrimicrobiaceae bacterium]|jgi:large subunit ribosomal protein L17
MRHRKNTVKLGRTTAHRDAMLANQVCSLIEHQRIKTTLAKAKAVRPLAEKMVTLGKRGDLHARRLAAGALGQKDAVKKLFTEIAPRAATRKGGYTRIVKLGPRASDSAPMAYIEWVDSVVIEPAADEVVAEVKKPAKKAPAKKPAAKKTADAAPESDEKA